MPMTDEFRDLIATMARGDEYTPFDEYNTYIGVGDGDDEFDPEHTDLQGGNKTRKPMKSGYPTRSDNTLVFESRFEEADAVFTWREAGVFNDGSGGTMMNRLLDDQGPKPSDEIWDYEITITVDHPE